jgi:hypothetical protein
LLSAPQGLRAVGGSVVGESGIGGRCDGKEFEMETGALCTVSLLGVQSTQTLPSLCSRDWTE